MHLEQSRKSQYTFGDTFTLKGPKGCNNGQNKKGKQRGMENPQNYHFNSLIR